MTGILQSIGKAAVGIKKILSVGTINPTKSKGDLKVLAGRAAIGSLTLLPPIVLAPVVTGTIYAATANPKTTLGLVGLGIASTQNKEIGKELIEAPSEFVQASLDAGKLSKNPTIAGVKDFIKKHPLFTALIAGTAIYAAYQAEQAIKNVGSGGTMETTSPTTSPTTSKAIIEAPQGTIGSGSVITPQTQEIGTTRRRKHKNKRQEALRQTIRQSVDINIINTNKSERHVSERYLNMIPVRS